MARFDTIEADGEPMRVCVAVPPGGGPAARALAFLANATSGWRARTTLVCQLRTPGPAEVHGTARGRLVAGLQRQAST